MLLLSSLLCKSNRWNYNSNFKESRVWTCICLYSVLCYAQITTRLLALLLLIFSPLRLSLTENLNTRPIP